MKRFIVFSLLFTSLTIAQGTAGTNAKYEYRSLIDVPTAGILERGNVGVTMDVLPDGVVISKIEVGVFDNFNFGISYGGSNIIGTGKVDWYKLPGINVRIRLANESLITPAITLGFDSQGKGFYNEIEDRYQLKSPGFFAAVSKNFELLGFLSLHGTLNYSLERNDGDKDVNLSIGFEKTIGSSFSLISEYDFAVNDNQSISFGDGNGYLNLGLRWSVTNGFTIGLDLRDMLDNKKLTSNKADRAIFVEFVNPIF